MPFNKAAIEAAQSIAAAEAAKGGGKRKGVASRVTTALFLFLADAVASGMPAVQTADEKPSRARGTIRIPAPLLADEDRNPTEDRSNVFWKVTRDFRKRHAAGFGGTAPDGSPSPFVWLVDYTRKGEGEVVHVTLYDKVNTSSDKVPHKDAEPGPRPDAAQVKAWIDAADAESVALYKEALAAYENEDFATA